MLGGHDCVPRSEDPPLPVERRLPQVLKDPQGTPTPPALLGCSIPCSGLKQVGSHPQQ